MIFCPSACPSYRGIDPERGTPVGRCDECGSYLYEDDNVHYLGRLLLCEDCAEDCDGI